MIRLVIHIFLLLVCHSFQMMACCERGGYYSAWVQRNAVHTALISSSCIIAWKILPLRSMVVPAA